MSASAMRPASRWAQSRRPTISPRCRHWLQEAAKLLALLHLADFPTLTEANVKLEKLMLSQQLKALLSDHIRYAPMALLPM